MDEKFGYVRDWEGGGEKVLIIIYGSDEAETDCKQCHEDVDVDVDKEEDDEAGG